MVLCFVRENFEVRKEKKKSESRHNFRSVFLSTELRSLFFLLILIQLCIFLVAPFLSLYVEFLEVPQEYVGLTTGA